VTDSTQSRNLIAGEWVASDQEIWSTNPSNTADLLGPFAAAPVSGVRAAVAAARRAAIELANTTPQARADALERAAAEITRRRDELALLVAREVGKPLNDALGEVARAANIFRFYSGEALRLHGLWSQSVRPGVTVEVRPEPLGVVGVICPWNFPLAIPAWKIAPALAYGNAVVFKPSEQASACGWAITEILSRTDLPRGSLSLLMGAADVGSALSAASTLDAITFTGSRKVGCAVRSNATANGVRVQLEMGGKNALVVLKDADLDLAVRCAIDGAFYFAGQRCTASSRLVVEREIADDFVARLVRSLSELRIGSAAAADVKLGPVASKSQYEKSLRYIDIGKADGARIVYGGAPVAELAQGYFLQPTLFVDTTNDMRINREEIFGPVAAIILADSLDHALSVTNDSEFGLVAGIVTRSIAAAEHFRRTARVGMAMVNLPTAGVDYHVPFGGTKHSSFGPREQGQSAREFYTTTKTCYLG
jgi:alpha-ketoglutaric semialdehyde dehydrogenase